MKRIKTTKRTRIYPNGDKYVGEFKEGESFFETLIKSTTIWLFTKMKKINKKNKLVRVKEKKFYIKTSQILPYIKKIKLEN